VIVIDTSALMAVLLREPRADICEDAMTTADELIISAGTLAEALVVADRRGVGAAMRSLLGGLRLTVQPIDATASRRVADAYGQWGKGVHPAGLNLMDCFAYALAADRGAQLLFIGNDFARTDVVAALPRPH
jgi:ribonuclease VapC